jgi:hypothetical protein
MYKVGERACADVEDLQGFNRACNGRHCDSKEEVSVVCARAVREHLIHAVFFCGGRSILFGHLIHPVFLAMTLARVHNQFCCSLFWGFGFKI